ncbi:MAG: nicotinate (nicotinamide) nucleotide adenylyltransferase [Magnetococcales bacterium]|nr:nicotinate (nicotinamide) nucleotide adenylyltransferase [Magnetococcales bacterium]
MTQRIGIFGGSFNPPHHGHLRLALECLEHLALQRLLFLPAGHHPFKSDQTVTVGHRLAMVELAIATEPRFSLCRHEAEAEGVCYTVDTLATLKSLYSDYELVFVVGSDLLAELHLWRQWRTLLHWAHLGCLQRPGNGTHYSDEVAAWLQIHQVATPAALRYDDKAGSHQVVWLPMTPLEISSSAIRQQLQQGRSPRYLLPDGVTDYIQQQGLYR